MEFQPEGLIYLDLSDASAHEVELLRQLQSVAVAGHSKVTLPEEETPSSPPPAAATAGSSPELTEDAPAQLPDDKTARVLRWVYETPRLPPDGVEFAAEEAVSTPGSAPPTPMLPQSQGLLGDMPAMGGMIQPPVPLQQLMPSAGQHQLYHPQQQCPPGYHPLYMGGMMYPGAGGYPMQGYPPPELPPVEPEPRAGRRGGKHGKQDKSVYGSGYPMTSRTAAGPPLVMAPYPSHPPYPHFFQMPYPHGYYYPGALPPEMMVPAQQHMDMSMPPPPMVSTPLPAAADHLPARGELCEPYGRAEVSSDPVPTAPEPAVSPAAVDAGAVRLSFGFDLEDKLGGEAGDSAAVQLETVSPVPPPAASAGEPVERLVDGRPASAEPGDTAARLLGTVPASYVATVTVSARVIGEDGELGASQPLQRCPSPAESQDSGVAHTDLELGSPVAAESAAVTELPPVSPAPAAGQTEVVTSPAADVAEEAPAAVETVAVVPTAAVSPPPPEEKQPEPAATVTPAAEKPAAAVPAPRSWASLFSKKVEAGGPSPSPAPAPKPVPAPPPPATDDELMSLGAALSRFELSHKPVPLQPRGLTNKSNWCYINAVLQALANCQPFYHLMKSLPSNIGLQSSQSRTPIIDAMVEFVSELRPLQDVPRISRRERERGQLRDLAPAAAFEPSYVYSMLSRVSNDAFRVAGRQEDAEEFLTCLLSGLQDEMSDVLKVYEKGRENETVVNGSTNGRDETQSEEDDDDNWQTIIGKNRGQVTRSAELQTTPISRIFSGQLRSALHRQGSKATATVQSFFSLQLDIQAAAVSSVEEALEQLVGRDAVVGLTCPTTGRPVEAWQQAALEVAPPTLILHLKRFLYDPASDGVQKLLKRVTYPVDLELKRDLLSAARGKLGPGQKKYRLFAVVYHAGKESTKGHYITDAYHPAYQQWVRYDDSTVTPVTEAAVLRPDSPLMPYILFYRRLEHPAAANTHNGK